MTSSEPFLSRVRLSPKYHALFHQLIPHLLAGRTIKEAAQIIDESLNECYRSIQFARFYYKSRTTFELVYKYLVETGSVGEFIEPQPVSELVELAEPISGGEDPRVGELVEPTSGIIPPGEEEKYQLNFTWPE